MGFIKIRSNGKPLSVHKAIVNPNFNSKTVIVSDTWEYVSLWLKRHNKKKAFFFWEQAKYFYKASLSLPNSSAPLTSYYFMLNATKAFLLSKNINIIDRHGLKGTALGELSLENEIVEFKQSGILSSLCQYFGETCNCDKYSLKTLLYNLPFIHRAFCLTFRSFKELFIPISASYFVRKKASDEAWFCIELSGRYASDRILNSIPKQFEKENGVTGKFMLRTKKRFKWVYSRNSTKKNFTNLISFHQKVRKNILYIRSNQRLWYLKKSYSDIHIIDRNTMVLIFACMHRLSEISRYSPDLMSRHLESRHNWVISEFIRRANIQFLDEISSEITGEEAMVPGYVS